MPLFHIKLRSDLKECRLILFKNYSMSFNGRIFYFPYGFYGFQFRIKSQNLLKKLLECPFKSDKLALTPDNRSDIFRPRLFCSAI